MKMIRVLSLLKLLINSLLIMDFMLNSIANGMILGGLGITGYTIQVRKLDGVGARIVLRCREYVVHF